mmetsp:Transcript_7547/g.12041  ORF Transcript_7547/g.12041 Transcript_7547/m.12041 type:complete len:477 (-) Transcript_7547:258-1688(-)
MVAKVILGVFSGVGAWAVWRAMQPRAAACCPKACSDVTLPDEALIHIFSYIDNTEDLAACSAVSKQWAQSSRQNSLWWCLFWKHAMPGSFPDIRDMPRCPDGFWKSMYMRCFHPESSLSPSAADRLYRSSTSLHSQHGQGPFSYLQNAQQNPLKHLAAWAQRALLVAGERKDSFVPQRPLLKELVTRTFFSGSDIRFPTAKFDPYLQCYIIGKELVTSFHIVNPDGGRVEFRCAVDDNNMMWSPDDVPDGISMHAVAYMPESIGAGRGQSASNKNSRKEADESLHYLSTVPDLLLDSSGLMDITRVQSYKRRATAERLAPSRTVRSNPGVGVYELCEWVRVSEVKRAWTNGYGTGHFVVDVGGKATAGIVIQSEALAEVMKFLHLDPRGSGAPHECIDHALITDFFRYILTCFSSARIASKLLFGVVLSEHGLSFPVLRKKPAEEFKRGGIQALRVAFDEIALRQSELWKRSIWNF